MKNKYISFIGVAALVLAAAFIIGMPKAQAAETNVTFRGELPNDSINYVIRVYDAVEGDPCPGTGAIGSVTASGDATYNDNNDYSITFNTTDTDAYIYFCSGTSSGSKLLDYGPVTVATDATYQIGLGRVGGTSINAGLNNDYVGVCSALGGTLLSTKEIQISAVTHDYDQYYPIDCGLNGASCPASVYVLFDQNNAGICTLDTDKSSGKKITIAAAENYGVYLSFAPDTVATGTTHVDINGKWLNVNSASGLDVGMTGIIAGAAYTLYYDNPTAGALSMYLRSGTAGTVFETISPLINGFVAQDFEGRISGSIPADLTEVKEVIGIITYSTSAFTGDTGHNNYALYIPDDAGARDLLFLKGATTEFTKNLNAGAAATVNVGKVSGSTHAALQTGDDLVKVYADAAGNNICTTLLSSAVVYPSAGAPNYEIYFEDTGANYVLQLTDAAGPYVSCGNHFTLAADQTATMNPTIQVSGIRHPDNAAILVDNDKGGTLTNGDVWTTSFDVGNVYHIYTAPDATSQVVVDNTDNSFTDIVLTTVTNKDFSTIDGVVDIAKVTGDTLNVSADLKGGGAVGTSNLVVYDAANGTTQMSSETVNMDTDYNQYFEVPSGGKANIEVQKAADSSKQFYVYNLTVAGAQTYLFEPNKKHTTTLPVNTIFPEVVGTTYTYRDKTLAGLGPYTSDIYLDNTETNTSDTENIYSENAFTNVVLTKTGRNLSAGNTAFNVDKLTGSSHADLRTGQETTDVLAVYDGGAADANPDCTGARLDSALNGNLANPYVKYYEHGTDAHYIWIKEQVTSNDYTYSSCVQTNETMAAAGATDTYNLDKKLSGNVATSISKVLVDVTGDSADWEFVALVNNSTAPPYSYKTYGTFAADTDARAVSGGTGILKVEGAETEQLTRTGNNWSGDGPFTWHVAKVSGDIANTATSVGIYGNADCSTGGALNNLDADPGTTYDRYFEGVDGGNYYVKVADGTYATCRTTRLDLVAQLANANFDQKINGRVPFTGTTAPLDVESVAISAGANNYWSDTVDAGTTDYVAYIDGNISTAIAFKDAAGGGGNVLLTVTKDATTDKTINVSAAHGATHADLDKINAVCETYRTLNTSCANKYSTVSPAGAGADYQIFFEEQGGAGTYYLETLDTDTEDYYAWDKFTTGGTAGSYVNVDLDGKLSGTVREDYNTSLGIPLALVGMYTDAGAWPANEVARAYSYGLAGEQASPAGNYRMYGPAGTYDAQASKTGYITNVDTTLGALSQVKNWDMASGIEVTVQDGGGNPITYATVEIYSCGASTVPADCTTLANTCVNTPTANCTRTGDNSAGNGANGYYDFAGIAVPTYIQIRVTDPSVPPIFEAVYSPDSSETVNSFVTSDTVALTQTVSLYNHAPSCTLTASGGAGTYERSGMVYAALNQDIIFRMDCGETGLTVGADVSALTGGAGVTPFTEDPPSSGSYIYTATIAAGATTGEKTITVTANDGVNIITRGIRVTVDKDAPATALTVTDPGDTDTTGVVKWEWNAAADGVGESGLAFYDVKISTDADCSEAVATEVNIPNGTLDFTYPGLTSGSTYYACVTAVDNVGNSGTQYNSNGIVIDTTAPSAMTLVIEGGKPYTNDKDAMTMAYSGQDVTTYFLSCDNSTWVALGASPQNIDLDDFGGGCTAADGTKTFQLKGVDANGNTTATAFSSIILDTAAPVITAGSFTATNTAGQSEVILAWDAATDNTSGIDHYNVYRKNSTGVGTGDTLIATVKPPNALNAIDRPEDGTWYYTATAVDLAGNESDIFTEDSVTVDTAVPTDLVISIDDGHEYTNTKDVNITVYATNAANMQFSCDGTTWTDLEEYGPTKAFDLAADGGCTDADGPKNVIVRMISTNGLISTLSDDIILDTVAPDVSGVVVTATADTVSNGQVDISWTAPATDTSGIASYTLYRKLGAGAGEVIASGLTQRTLKDAIGVDGTYAYAIVAIDKAGNTSAVSAYSTDVTIDVVGPTPVNMVVTGAKNGYVNNKTLNLSLITADAANMQFSCDGATWTASEPVAATKALDLTTAGGGCTDTDGLKTVLVKLTSETASSYASAYVTLDTKIDTDVATVNPTTDQVLTEKSYSWTWTPAVDNGSGIAYYDVELSNDNGTTWTYQTARVYGNIFTFANLDVKNTVGYVLRVKAYDNIGNSGDWIVSAGKLVADNIPPTVLHFNPNNGDLRVSIRPMIELIFSEAMDVETFTPANIQLYKTSAPGAPIGINVFGTPEFSEEGVKETALQVIPGIDLSYDTEYTLVVSNAVTDLYGNPFAGLAVGDYTFTTGSEDVGILSVDGPPQQIKSWGVPGGLYAQGWEWKLNVTIPTNQTSVDMEFSDWYSTTGPMPTANNMRYYSPTSLANKTEGTAIPIIHSNTYGVPKMVMDPTLDGNPNEPGIQAVIYVQTQIPLGTAVGSYSAAYDLRSTPTP